jgi:hypothetical protein
VRGMRSLLAAAVGVAAALVHAVSGGTHPVTVYGPVKGTISAFTQDGSLVSWFAPGTTGCNSVHVLSLANGLHVVLPQQGGARNVTCRWDVGSSHVDLALAGSTALWTLRAQAPIPFDYLLGAGAAVGERKERRFQELAHTGNGTGLWLGGLAGDRGTLVYGVTSIDYVDEAGCLAGTSPCDLKVVGGGVYRMAGRQLPKLVPGTDPGGVVEVAASAGAVAFVPAGGLGKGGRPLADAGLPIEIVDATTGAEIASAEPQGAPVALSLTPHVLATLERTPLGLRIAWYSRSSGALAGSIPVSSDASSSLAANDHTIVYRVGLSIRAVDIETHAVRSLARAGSEPVGLSLEGRRLAWAENVNGSARIRALYLKQ